MLNNLKNYLVTFIGVLSGIAGLIGLKIGYFSKLASETEIAVWFLGGFAVYYFADTLYLRTWWKQKVKYASTFEHLNRGLKEIQSLSRLNDDSETKLNEREVVAAFEELCTAVAAAFSEIKNTKCSACIKILESTRDPKQVSVNTLCRNKDVDPKRKRADKKSNQDDIQHTIQENTDFSKVFNALDKPLVRTFVSNSLPFDGGYKNTSFHLYDGDPHRGLNPIKRWWAWPLPYQSTIVAPIYPLDTKPGENATLLGFLCVDSPKLGTFANDSDIRILEGVADGIYNTLNDFKGIVR
jgi:hypothetical protein